MLVDDNIFCGSLNLANSYTSVRYGDGSFRDLNIILRGHPAKRVRDFFRTILLRNEKYWPEKIKGAKIKKFLIEHREYSIIACPEACGVNLTATMQKIGIELEWPPENVAYQIVLAGIKNG